MGCGSRGLAFPAHWINPQWSHYTPPVDITDFMLWKLLALVAIVFLGNFFYTLVTGRSLPKDLHDRQEGPGSPPER